MTDASRQSAYVWNGVVVYGFNVDVAVTELRAHLSDWINVVRDGNEVVITDRGAPVARIIPLDSATILERLTASGTIGRPAHAARPVAGSRHRPTPQRPVADIVSEQRR